MRATPTSRAPAGSPSSPSRSTDASSPPPARCRTRQPRLNLGERPLKKIICATAVAIAVLAPAASALPGTGETSRLVAVGPSGQTLSCTTSVHDMRYTGSTYHRITGTTTCGGAIQQSCELTHVAKNGASNTVLTGGGFSTTCGWSKVGD